MIHRPRCLLRGQARPGGWFRFFPPQGRPRPIFYIGEVMNLSEFLKRLANPYYGQKGAEQSLKTPAGMVPRVDEITPDANPATPGGISHPGESEMEGIRGFVPEIEQTRPRPGTLGEGSRGPMR